MNWGQLSRSSALSISTPRHIISFQRSRHSGTKWAPPLRASCYSVGHHVGVSEALTLAFGYKQRRLTWSARRGHPRNTANRSLHLINESQMGLSHLQTPSINIHFPRRRHNDADVVLLCSPSSEGCHKVCLWPHWPLSYQFSPFSAICILPITKAMDNFHNWVWLNFHFF